MPRSFVYCTLFLLLFSPRTYSHPIRPSATPTADTTKLSCLERAEHLLDEALGFMEKNYYRRDQVQWGDLATAARARLNTADNCEDAYGTISWCFTQLNEQHSFVMPPSSAAMYNYDTAALAQTPSLAELVGEIKGEWLDDSIAYLTIPWVSTTDSLICMQIADSLQSLISRLDTRGISKWIIDLRKNSGGNCWPMLAGVGPLLGEGVCGYFVADQEKIPIAYRDGAAFQGKHVRCRVSNPGYHIKSGRNMIVVLTGHRTVSAGEIVALAFKGKEQAYLYGEPTAGLTTANATYSLSDHSMLILTVCQEADHTGKVCEGSIIPDKLIASTEAAPLHQDAVKAAAIHWLQGANTGVAGENK